MEKKVISLRPTTLLQAGPGVLGVPSEEVRTGPGGSPKELDDGEGG